MKYRLLLLTLILVASCNTNQTKKTENKPETIYIEPNDQDKMADKSTFTGEKEICWEGKLDGKTPIFIHYQLSDDVIIGEITYLNTKGKKPIKLAGTMLEDNYFRFLEFDKTGNITGILTGQFDENALNGTWFSPKTRKELKMNLSFSDSIVKSEDITVNSRKMAGEYYYQYGKEGYTGSFTFDKVTDRNFSFKILSVTDEPARNIAFVDTDTISLKGNSFVYTVKQTEKCGFKVRFFKDFIFIDYTNGYCLDQFGHNATVEGIYLKVK